AGAPPSRVHNAVILPPDSGVGRPMSTGSAGNFRNPARTPLSSAGKYGSTPSYGRYFGSRMSESVPPRLMGSVPMYSEPQAAMPGTTIASEATPAPRRSVRRSKRAVVGEVSRIGVPPRRQLHLAQTDVRDDRIQSAGTSTKATPVRYGH